MRIDLTTVIQALNGEAFTTGAVRTVEKTGADGTVVRDDQGSPVMVTEQVGLTARDLLVSAYANPATGVSLIEKVKRGAMAQKIYEAPQFVELTADDVVEAKKLLDATVQHPVIMMRMVQLLDPPASVTLIEHPTNGN